MGNHEFCTRCHASDFHIGMTCEEAYPERLKKVEKEKKEQKKRVEEGTKLAKKLAARLKKLGYTVYETEYPNRIEVWCWPKS
jgi:hypothetical protein